MKEEWKVYIKGVQGRGEEVKQALINLGGYVVRNYNYTVSYCLYYINHNGEIRCAEKTTEIGKIIMDNYKEIKLPEKWKDGDILVSRSNSQVMALYEFVSDKDADLFNAYFRIDDNMIFSHSLEVRERFRSATDQEVKTFYEILHKHHKDWDAEKKQLVDWRWKPKEDETYWVVYGNGRITSLKWVDFSVGTEYFDFGNCFKTKEDAEIAAEKIKKLLKGEQL